MMNIRYYFFFIIIGLYATSITSYAQGQQQQSPQQQPPQAHQETGQKNQQQKVDLSGQPMPSHPRILMLAGEEDGIRQSHGADETWSSLHEAMMAECEDMLSAELPERTLNGRRLLSVSRRSLHRIFYLSYAWRMSGEEKYFRRAEAEMLAVSAFSDWNPSHFLDVAEMTMGVAIGYDWLFDVLSDSSKAIIKEAILKKGIEPSLDPAFNGWLEESHNWNQVGNAGMTYGALAIYEEEPELAEKIIERAIETIVLSMKDYGPDGAYPEGYMYWGYGTSFNIMFLSALEKVYGHDFGLSDEPGFLKTAAYILHMTGPSGKPFNYSDAGTGGGLKPAMFWFSDKLKDPSLLWVEKSRLMENDPARQTRDRLLPAIMVWKGDVKMEDIIAPEEKMWTGGGKNPVALMRSSWTDPQAIYVGMKGGSPSVNHGHMDVGSFVMEAEGIRWAIDFGSQGYTSLESKGIKIWNRDQDSQRWEVFRYTNQAHNTLTVNDQLQRVEGFAPISSYSDQPDFMNAVMDISALYTQSLASAKRGIAIVDNQYVLVRDETQATNNNTKIRWNLLTPAEVEITGKNTAMLSKDGKKLLLKVISPKNVEMKTWSTDPPKDYDAENPGTILTGFETTQKKGKKTVLKVQLIPQPDEGPETAGTAKAGMGGKIEKTNSPLKDW